MLIGRDVVAQKGKLLNKDPLPVRDVLDRSMILCFLNCRAPYFSRAQSKPKYFVSGFLHCRACWIDGLRLYSFNFDGVDVAHSLY